MFFVSCKQIDIVCLFCTVIVLMRAFAWKICITIKHWNHFSQWPQITLHYLLLSKTVKYFSDLLLFTHTPLSWDEVSGQAVGRYWKQGYNNYANLRLVANVFRTNGTANDATGRVEVATRCEQGCFLEYILYILHCMVKSWFVLTVQVTVDGSGP